MNSPRTPPKIVANATDSKRALATFIAQELEAWGFRVATIEDKPYVIAVGAERWQGYIKVEEINT